MRLRFHLSCYTTVLGQAFFCAQLLVCFLPERAVYDGINKTGRGLFDHCKVLHQFYMGRDEAPDTSNGSYVTRFCLGVKGKRNEGATLVIEGDIRALQRIEQEERAGDG